MCSGCRARTAERLGPLLALAIAVASPAGALPPSEVAFLGAPALSPVPANALRSAAIQPAAFPVGRICDLIEASALRHGLPPAYFARLIWKESRFDIGAVSPVGAQGIAQFMPGTAKLEGLTDPFDPRLAIPASARHLSDLRAEFGNLGLAAAAYNSGRNRVSRWLAGAGGLPWETRDYVLSITAKPAEWFTERDREHDAAPLEAKRPFGEACRRLPILKTRAVFAGVPMQPWGAQVAGGIDSRAASRAFERVRRLHPSLMGAGEPLILRNRRGAGPRYAARVGQPDRGAAVAFCRRLTAAGGACVVRRN